MLGKPTRLRYRFFYRPFNKAASTGQPLRPVARSAQQPAPPMKLRHEVEGMFVKTSTTCRPEKPRAGVVTPGFLGNHQVFRRQKCQTTDNEAQIKQRHTNKILIAKPSRQEDNQSKKNETKGLNYLCKTNKPKIKKRRRTNQRKQQPTNQTREPEAKHTEEVKSRSEPTIREFNIASTRGRKDFNHPKSLNLTKPSN